MGVDLEPVNIVVSGNLGTGELDVEKIGEDLEVNIIDIYPGRIYLKMDEEEPMVMLFRSGSYTIAGAKSEVDIEETIHWMISLFQEIGVETSAVRESMSTQYMVFEGDLGDVQDLNVLSVRLGLENTEYEPEQFPALIYRPEDYCCTVLIFSTGKVLITGVNNEDTAIDVFDFLRSL